MSGRRARVPALGSVELLLVQLLRSDPLLSARDALLVGPLKAGFRIARQLTR